MGYLLAHDGRVAYLAYSTDSRTTAPSSARSRTGWRAPARFGKGEVVILTLAQLDRIDELDFLFSRLAPMPSPST